MTKPPPPNAPQSVLPSPIGKKSAAQPLKTPTVKSEVKISPPAAKSAPAKNPTAPVKPSPSKNLFQGPVTADIINEDAARAAYKRVTGLIAMQTGIIAILAFILVFGQPLFQPIYKYYTVDGQQQNELSALLMPNMTNRAVLSWAASSITEVMTIGFGDFERKLVAQKSRFTSDGWSSFVQSFHNQKIDETFRKNQLVLTTVPSGPPEILSQGQNAKHIYEWKIKMPVVMTYATNNNVTQRERATISLTIVRSAESPNGIAIETWAKT